MDIIHYSYITIEYHIPDERHIDRLIFKRQFLIWRLINDRSAR